MDNNNPMYHHQSMDGDVKAFCRRYMNFQVMAQMNDGSQFDGIIESMDEDGVTMLVPEEIDEDQLRQVNDEGKARQFNYDYGRPRRRRFRRFPFGLFSRLFLYPYYYPYYPWY